MKKFFILIFVLSSILFSGAISKNVKAFEYNDDYYDMLNITDLEALDIEFKEVVNRTYKGEFYRVGVMGHRRVVELGELKSLKYVVLSHSDTYLTSSISNLEQIITNSYTVNNSTTTTKQVKIGFISIMKRAVNLLDVASVGKESSPSIEVTMGSSTTYAEQSFSSTQTNVQFNLAEIYPGLLQFKLGQVALVAEFEVVKSYTQEDRLFKGWTKLKDTEVTNYRAYLYLETLTTFIYTDSFGTASTGLYPLGEINH